MPCERVQRTQDILGCRLLLEPPADGSGREVEAAGEDEWLLLDATGDELQVTRVTLQHPLPGAARRQPA